MTNPPDEHRLLERFLWLSLATALATVTLKAAAAVITNSVGMWSDALESTVNLLAAGIALWALRVSARPADHNHDFGHGKAESLASLAQAAFITGSALVLVMNGFSRLVNPEPLKNLDIGIWVTVGSLALTLVLVTFQSLVVQKTQSQAIRADRLHYQSDVLFNIGVLLALGCSWYGWLWADGLFAILLGLFILKGALEIGYEAVQTLLDRQLPDGERAQIVELVKSVPGVHGIHDLRTRQAGPLRFIQLHLELEDTLPLMRAHDLADQAEALILDKYPGADVIIHMDPISAVGHERSTLLSPEGQG